MLKKRYESEDEIPEAARGFYTEDEGGGWVLSLEDDRGGRADKGRIEEFRTKNIALQKQLDEVQSRLESLGDIDPETIKSAMANLAKTQNDEELQLVQAGKLDEVVSRRTQAMQANYQKQFAALEAEKKKAAEQGQKAYERFSSVFMAEQLGSALEKRKLRLRPTARQDLLMRAGGTFKPTEGLDALAPKEDAYGPDGKELSLDSWIETLVDEAPHLFEGGSGGGARAGGPAGGKAVYSRDEYRNDPQGFANVAAEIAEGKATWKD